ncbi:hypothetical protein GOP47_0023426 [Adiantum capillus-veneris]|uniref:Auxin-responsive protein n=1 Tax=Adiantum capillus-veneris TaxID=13818 RepID=A0A9D4U3G5_ADICA|nr:hypothetical protein GOP47_0023426 [Adiantum capillus-veneris]
MSRSLYARGCPSVFPDPISIPALICPVLPFESPAVERDYMGIGLGVKDEKASSSTASFSAAALMPTSADDLCGSHLKLAPPSSSADDDGGADGADDDEPLSGNIGWPPISSYRKATTRSLSTKEPCPSRDTIGMATLVHPQGHLIDDQEFDASQADLSNDECSSRMINPSPKVPTRKSLHIKVSMDGTPIMRKLDLETIQGYRHLSLELHKLFKFYKRNLSCEVGAHSSFKESGDADFLLTYKDKDGDWMLVGNTPWELFARTARRLRIMKKVK